MSALDFGARAMAARLGRSSRRLSTIDTLLQSIARNSANSLPPVMAAPMAENRSATTQIASGTLYGFSSSNPAAHYGDRYTLLNGSWEFLTSTILQPYSVHLGNGTDPAAGNTSTPSTVRFCTHADKFEIYCQNFGGFRVKVNGEYAKAGLYGVPSVNGDTNGALRYFLFDFGSSALRFIEIEGDDYFRFGGIRVPATHSVAPWPDPSGLRAATHGDSMLASIMDSGSYMASAYPPRTSQLVRILTGVSDVWATAIGGVGFVSDGGGTKSDFIEQAPIDFPAGRFDLVWEFGGKNDYVLYGSQSAYQAVIESWLDIVIGNTPDLIVIMGGPIPSGNSESYGTSAATTAIQNAKKAACNKYPRNCAFIETVGNSIITQPWVFGTGKQTVPANNGNADLIIGSDGVHPTIFGHNYLASRIVTETAKVLPNLRSRILNGVIAGANDVDLV